MKKDTQCVHGGTHVDPETKGLNTLHFAPEKLNFRIYTDYC